MTRIEYLKFREQHPDSPLLQGVEYALFKQPVPGSLATIEQLNEWCPEQRPTFAPPPPVRVTNQRAPVTREFDIDFSFTETWTVNRHINARATVELHMDDFTELDHDRDRVYEVLEDRARDQLYDVMRGAGCHDIEDETDEFVELEGAEFGEVNSLDLITAVDDVMDWLEENHPVTDDDDDDDDDDDEGDDY
jgi:hypothetical protein